MTTINEAVRAAMDEWLKNGTTNVDAMRDFIEDLVDDAIVDWHADHPEATTNEEQGHD